MIHLSRKRFIVFGVLFASFLYIYSSVRQIESQVQAQTNPCDYTIGAGVGTADGNDNYSSVQPGDVVCISAGTRGILNLNNFKGTASQPITFINSGGQVDIETTEWVGIELKACEYVRLTGTGDTSVEYGFKIHGPSNCGVYTNLGGSQHLEIDHIEIYNSAGAGIRSGQAKDKSDWRGYGYYLHHNYIHDVSREGFYVGGAAEFEEVEIAYNRVEQCGWDGIQVGNAVNDVKVHHNLVKDVGLDPDPGSGGGNGRSGFATGCTGEFYNNMVINPARWGFYFQGIGNYKIYNNVIINAGQLAGEGHGIVWWNGDNGLIYNNTIVYSKDNGIQASSGRTGEIYDNIVLESGTTNILNRDVAKYNNIESGSVESLKFADSANNDFHLTASSPAVDAGSNTGFALFDFDDVTRPQGTKADIGAYEYTEGAQSIILSSGWNKIIWPNLSGIKASDIPDACPMAVARENFWFRPYVKNYGGGDFEFESGKTYYLKCNQEVIWTP